MHPDAPPAPEAVFVRVEREGHAMTLRLVEDPQGTEKALVHARGWAISHVERVVPNALAEVLALALRELAASGEGPAAAFRVAEPVGAALVRAAASRGSFARVSVLRRTPARPAWPRWSFAARARLVGDPELSGLRAGVREAIKRESPDAEAAARDAAALDAAGLRTRTVGTTTWAARDDDELEHAIADDRAIAGRGEAADAAVRRIGVRLGYPPCCVERFLALGPRDDATLASVLLPRWSEVRHDARATWLLGPLALVSHAPCTPDCAPTRALATLLLDALDQDHPGFAAEWRDLAESVTAIDTTGRALLLDLTRHDDRWRMTLTRARELLPDGAVRDLPDLHARRLRESAGTWTEEDGPPIRIPWAIDHRPP